MSANEGTAIRELPILTAFDACPLLLLLLLPTLISPFPLPPLSLLTTHKRKPAGVRHYLRAALRWYSFATLVRRCVYDPRTLW